MSARDLIAKHRPTELSRSGQLRFAQYVRAVQNPGALLDDMDRGVVEPEVLETWQALYPEELDELRQVLTDEISRAAAEGHEFPEKQVRMFDEILGGGDSGYTSMLQKNYEPSERVTMGGPTGGEDIELASHFDRAVQRI
jgi:hypothetical protein